jgi:hypothetical protein
MVKRLNWFQLRFLRINYGLQEGPIGILCMIKWTQLRGRYWYLAGKLSFVWLHRASGSDDDFFFKLRIKDFKWSQVWRTSLGLDHKFDNDYIVTLDMS